ncbi:MAG: hypothetical protein U0797_24370 [Gemmataceae bacterium]
MDEGREHEINERAYKRLKAQLPSMYPTGWFVAFVGGEVVADAARFRDLRPKLAALGMDSPRAFVVQVGVDYPEYAVIVSPVIQG